MLYKLGHYQACFACHWFLFGSRDAIRQFDVSWTLNGPAYDIQSKLLLLQWSWPSCSVSSPLRRWSFFGDSSALAQQWRRVLDRTTFDFLAVCHWSRSESDLLSPAMDFLDRTFANTRVHANIVKPNDKVQWDWNAFLGHFVRRTSPSATAVVRLGLVYQDPSPLY